MKKYNVLIVEDDFRVADINKSVVEQVDGFHVVTIAKSATEAFSFISGNHLDLILVDIYLPDYSGIELLKKIRKNEIPVDVILITAAVDADTIENSMRYGVFDYIIKPFIFSRFIESLENYKEYHSSITGSVKYDQNIVNGLISHKQSNVSKGVLPKGITQHTLLKISTAVNKAHKTFTIDDIILETDLSKITIRRYLGYLEESGQLKKSYEYKKIGRPSIIYSNKQNN